MKSDTHIISQCLQGDQIAFKQLYNKYKAYCYGMCIRYAINQSDIKDVVQIIFTQTFHSLKNYDHEQSQFKTWFTHVCINNILSYKKKQMKHSLLQDIDVFDESTNLYTEENVEAKIDKEYVLQLLSQMPDNYQIVFNLFIIDGYSHEEIANQLNISIASSRVLLSRARGWVKKNLVNQLKS